MVLASIPLAPTHLEMPQAQEILFLAMGSLLLVGVVAQGVRLARREGDFTLLMCVAGGAAASLLEPVIGLLGLMYLPERGAMRTFEFFDRAMPLFVITSYAGYIGGLTYLAYRRFAQGVTVRDVFALWAVLAVANIAFETPAVLMDVYSYYGPQPLNPWGFPLWWGFVNPLTSMIAGAVILRLRPQLSGGLRPLLIVPIVFAADGAANGAAASPMWLTLSNTELARVWTYVGAAATLGLVLMVVWFVAQAVSEPATYAKRSPTDALRTAPEGAALAPR